MSADESLTEGKDHVVDEGRIPDPMDLTRFESVMVDEEPSESGDLGEVPEAKTKQ